LIGRFRIRRVVVSLFDRAVRWCGQCMKRRKMRRFNLIAIIVLGMASAPVVNAQPSPDTKAFGIKQDEFKERFNQVASVNQLKAHLEPDSAGNLDLNGCDMVPQVHSFDATGRAIRSSTCYYTAYGRFEVHTDAAESGNVRIIRVITSSYMDTSAFSDSISTIVALVDPRLPKHERENSAYMILGTVMDKTRRSQVLKEFSWGASYVPSVHRDSSGGILISFRPE
jgi:hypothetical protein